MHDHHGREFTSYPQTGEGVGRGEKEQKGEGSREGERVPGPFETSNQISPPVTCLHHHSHTS